MKNKIKIKFEAVGTTDTVEDICNNFSENYPELANNMEENDYMYNPTTKEFMLLWVGEFDEDELTDDELDEIIRLTHHAEGFYLDTDAEYVHVEVCINNKWYGREK